MTNSGNIKDDREIIDRLRAITPLKFIREDDIRGLLKSSKMIKYDPGELIFEEGEHGSWLYFLIKGEVRIQKKGEIITVLKRRGDLFGEMSVIDNSPRSASIVAINHTICLAIDSSYSKKLDGNEKNAFNAIIYRIFAEILAERLRAMDEELVKAKGEAAMLRSELEKLMA
jgi:CRP/FNR family transcriptional regulator, cyclic AMP receptor protein